MSCKKYSISIPGDIDGKLAKAISDISQSLGFKYKTIETALSIIAAEKYEREDLQKALDEKGINKIKKELINEYIAQNPTGTNSIVRIYDEDNLRGFTSGVAKATAINYVASNIILELQRNINTPESEQETNDKIIEKIVNDLRKQLFLKIDEIINDPSYKEKNKDLTQRLIDAYVNNSRKLTESIANYNSINKRLRAISSAIKKGEDKSKFKDEVKELNREKARLTEDIAVLRGYKYIDAINIVNALNREDSSNFRIRDFANLVSLASVNSRDFFKEVAINQALTNINKSFIDSLNNSQVHYLDDDVQSFNSEDAIIILGANDETDEYSKSWNENIFKSYTQYIDTAIKFELSTIPRLTEFYDDMTATINNEENKLPYDTDNPLGVRTFYNYKFVVQQLVRLGNFNSPDDFIESVAKMASRIKELNGFSVLYNKMLFDRALANRIFVALGQPIVDKTIIDVADGQLDVSNPLATADVATYFKYRNVFKSTFYDAYDVLDVTGVENLIKKIKSKNLNIRAKIKEFNQNKNLIVSILNKYLPTVDSDVLFNYINEDSLEQQQFRRINEVLSIVNNLVDAASKALNEFNKINKQNRDISFSNAFIRQSGGIIDGVTVKEQEYKKFDFSSLNIRALDASLITLSKIINRYSAISIELNSSNAEGNMSTNMMKNSYFGRFFQKLKMEEEVQDDTGQIVTIRSGLESIKNEVTKGESNGASNQYAYNPIYFGIRNAKGSTIVPGLFSRDGQNVVTTRNAHNILQSSLFDGVRDLGTVRSALYNTMSRSDYFLTQFLSFLHPAKRVMNGTFSDTLEGHPRAEYFMRTPSDAPKNFTVQYFRLNDVELRASFTQHLTQELCDFITQLNNVLNANDDFSVREDTTGLIDRAHHDRGKIIKNGRLAGNLFKFNKLFKVGSLDVNERMVNSLSLYGEGKDSLIKYDSVSGKYRLNMNQLGKLFTIEDGKIKFILTKETKKIIGGIAGQWQNEFTKYIINNSQEFKDIIGKTVYEYNENDLVSFFLNSANMNMNFDMLFEGDTKFYRNARDFLKRTKEGQAGGLNYTGYNLSDESFDDVHDILDAEGLFIPIMIKKDGKLQESGMNARNGFRAITITNKINFAKSRHRLLNELKQIHINEGMSEIEATTAASKETIAYFEQGKFDDAQSYITFEEWIRRRFADGTIGDYQDIIQQIYEVRSGKRTRQEIDLSSIIKRIQVDKNFYFDHYYDTETQTYYPRQIKNAEFVIIPELLSDEGIKDESNDLIRLYNICVRNDIGQINTSETSKAAKKNVLTFWDNNGVVNKNFEKDIKNLSAIENFYYQYLWKQQEVPEHMKDKTNKAGVQIMKKVLDNLSNDETRSIAEDFMRNYVANIKQDFEYLLDNCGWKFDEKTGHIVNKDGSEDLDFTVFYEKALREAARLGMDSNFIEYFIPDPDTGKPKMPNYMNNTGSKIESIVQAIFNSTITRQTLPGWHAAQITDVGYSGELKYHPAVYKKDDETLSEEEYNKLDDKTGWNMEVEAYMEVYLPRWSSLIPKGKTSEEDKQILDQISKEGLDIHIGYRIPTEGKQSVSVLKVVGFVDDSYGSTIVVPDEWVIQSGADFDVDSIYGICYEMYRDKYDMLHKIEFINPWAEDVSDEERENIIQKMYADYINERLVKRQNFVALDDIDREEIKESLKSNEKLKELRKAKNQFRFLDAKLGEKYDKLSKDAKERVDVATKYIESKTSNGNYSAADITRLRSRNIIAGLTQLLNSVTDETQKEKIESYIETQKQLLEQVNILETLDKNNINYEAIRNKLYEDVVKENWDNYFAAMQSIAKENGIITYEEFKELPVEEMNTKQARNNKILDSIIAIMNNPSSRTENYATSNFRDITEAKIVLEKILGVDFTNSSPYDPFIQLRFMDDVMSGARLKAISVNYDTFASVANYTKALLGSETVDISYDLTREKDGKKVYNLESIQKAYNREGEIEVIRDKNNVPVKVIVHHSRIGWSETNKNVTDSIITVYNSETTAHTLDAVKEGSIYNLNEETFGAYKLLPMIGADYDTAIAFIMQPAITELNRINVGKKSPYFTESGKPIFTAIKQLYGRYYKTKKYVSWKEIEKTIKNDTELAKCFEQINFSFTEGRSILSGKSILDYNVLVSRLKKEKELNNKSDAEYTTMDFAIDLMTLIEFNRLSEISNNINQIMNDVKSDKFGAKQTVNETRKLYKDIIEHSYPRDSIEARIANTVVVEVKDQTIPLVQAVYPRDVENSGKVVIDRSKYMFLAAFLNYSTEAAIETNSQFFELESSKYDDIRTRLEERIGRKLTAEQYKDYTKYIVNYFYNSIPQITNPITVDDFGNIQFAEYDVDENESVFSKEMNRIVGYTTTSTNLFVQDINNPTREEIDKFRELTPAQKVIFIQTNFKRNGGLVFDNIEASVQRETINKLFGYSGQSIRFNSSIEFLEDLFIQFNSAFYNSNPLIKLAAIDLVKYAIVVDGMMFKKGGISRIITNKSLLGEDSTSLDIVPQLRAKVANSTSSELLNGEFLNLYLRSHSEVLPVYNLGYVKSTKLQPYQKAFIKSTNHTTFGLRHIMPGSNNNTQDTENTELLNRLELTIGEGENIQKLDGRYIKIVWKDKINDKVTQITTIFKVRIAADNSIFLIPQPKLERGETTQYSYNKSNNRGFRVREFYDSFIDIYNTMVSKKGTILDINDLDEFKSKLKEEGRKEETKIPENTLYTEYDATSNPNTLMEVLESKDKEKQLVKGGIQLLIDDIFNEKFGVIGEENSTSKMFTFNMNPYIRMLFPYNAKVKQVIRKEINGEMQEIEVTIVRGMRPSKLTSKNEHQRKIYDSRVGSKGISTITNEDGTKSKNTVSAGDCYMIEKDNTPTEDETYNASLYIDLDEYTTVGELDSEFNKQTATIVNVLHWLALGNDETASEFDRLMDINYVNSRLTESLEENTKIIYREASIYFRKVSNKLLKDMNNFELANGNVYSIDDERLYKELQPNSEDYHRLVKLLLDARTFGHFIVNAKFSKDPTINKYIEDINKFVSNVKNSDLTLKGFENMFNIYYARFSSNPNIAQGILKLRDVFGDVSKLDMLVADISDVTHPEIQVITKIINAMNSEIQGVVIPEEIEKFEQELAELMKLPGEFRIDNIITSDGRWRTNYTDEFLRDKEKVIDMARDAVYKHGMYSMEWLDARIARDEWLLENTEQPIVEDYYRRSLNNLKRIRLIAPELYLEYMKIQSRLYEDVYDESLSEEERIKLRVHLREQLNSLLSKTDEDGEEKSPQELRKVEALKDFLAARKNINAEYFTYEEYEGFQDDVDNYLAIRDRYDKKYATLTLNEKLDQFEEYREAYYWLKENVRFQLSDENQDKLEKAYFIITGASGGTSQDIIEILNDENAYDEFGRRDPRKLSDRALEQIKQKQLSRIKKIGGTSHNSLIKEVPKDIPLLNAKAKRELERVRAKESGKPRDNSKKDEYIKKINAIIEPFFDKDNNTLDTVRMFKTLSKEERNRLNTMYIDLFDIPVQDGKINRQYYKLLFEEYVTKAYNNAAFKREQAKARRELSEDEYKEWLKMFADAKIGRKNGKVISLYTPKFQFFGYYVPTKEEYEDKEKAKALATINDMVERVPSEYYLDAEKQAIADGTYDEWYEKNHIFNQYTQRWEPLSIWTVPQYKGSAKDSIQRLPRYEAASRAAVKEKQNEKFSKFGDNFKDAGNPIYTSTTRMTEKERRIQEYLKSIVMKYASGNYQMEKFAAKGYLPRRYKKEYTATNFARDLLNVAGLAYYSTRNVKDHEGILDYTKQWTDNFEMMETLKTKGFKPMPDYPKREGKTKEEYQEELRKYREESRKIEAHNRELEKAVLDKDWINVIKDYIAGAIEYNNRHTMANTIFLLMEELKINKHYLINSKGKMERDSIRSIDTNEYKTEESKNAMEILENWARRIIYKDYNRHNVWRDIFDSFRTNASSRYIALNPYSGFANIATGYVNMTMEFFGNEYFTKADAIKAQAEYAKGGFSYLQDVLNFSDEDRKNITNRINLIIHRFNIIDYDLKLETRPNDKMHNGMKHLRNIMFGTQSAGEHLMQNTVLIAMLNGTKIMRNKLNGNEELVSKEQYKRYNEIVALYNILQGDQKLLDAFEQYKRKKLGDKREMYKYAKFKYNFSIDFIKEVYYGSITGTKDKKILDKYLKEKERLDKEAEEEFNDSRNKTLNQMIKVVNGKLVFDEKFKKYYGEFRERVIGVNKKIHGVYDKDGAALIEKYAFGANIMQFHKHLWTGFMKHYKNKGNFSERRGTVDRGMFTDIAHLLVQSMSIINNYNNARKDGTNPALAAFQAIVKSTIGLIPELYINYRFLPRHQKQNMKKIMGELIGMTVPIVVQAMVFSAFGGDDDELRDNNLASSIIYAMDRLMSETIAYNGYGTVQEAKTLWGSPVASGSAALDWIYLLYYGTETLMGEDLTIHSGPNAGDNRLNVVAKRLFAPTRVINRIKNIGKNNRYYRVGNKGISTKIAKALAGYESDYDSGVQYDYLNRDFNYTFDASQNDFNSNLNSW